MYVAQIRALRKLVVVSLVVCYSGCGVCAAVGFLPGTAFLAVGAMTCSILLPALFAEVLVRRWLERRRSGPSLKRFTLGEMLVAFVVAALLLTLLPVLGAALIPLAVILVVFVAWIAEARQWEGQDDERDSSRRGADFEQQSPPRPE